MWSKGQSGNPRGAPKRNAPMTRAELDRIIDKVTGGPQKILDRIWGLAANEDQRVAIQALKLVAAYRIGEPVARLEVGGTDGGPLRAIILHPPDDLAEPESTPGRTEPPS
jgi:hypothetical protein